MLGWLSRKKSARDLARVMAVAIEHQRSELARAARSTYPERLFRDRAPIRALEAFLFDA